MLGWDPMTVPLPIGRRLHGLRGCGWNWVPTAWSRRRTWHSAKCWKTLGASFPFEEAIAPKFRTDPKWCSKHGPNSQQLREIFVGFPYLLLRFKFLPPSRRKKTSNKITCFDIGQSQGLQVVTAKCLQYICRCIWFRWHSDLEGLEAPNLESTSPRKQSASGLKLWEKRTPRKKNNESSKVKITARMPPPPLPPLPPPLPPPPKPPSPPSPLSSHISIITTITTTTAAAQQRQQQPKSTSSSPTHNSPTTQQTTIQKPAEATRSNKKRTRREQEGN